MMIAANIISLTILFAVPLLLVALGDIPSGRSIFVWNCPEYGDYRDLDRHGNGLAGAVGSISLEIQRRKIRMDHGFGYDETFR